MTLRARLAQPDRVLELRGRFKEQWHFFQSFPAPIDTVHLSWIIVSLSIDVIADLRFHTRGTRALSFLRKVSITYPSPARLVKRWRSLWHFARSAPDSQRSRSLRGKPLVAISCCIFRIKVISTCASEDSEVGMLRITIIRMRIGKTFRPLVTIPPEVVITMFDGHHASWPIWLTWMRWSYSSHCVRGYGKTWAGVKYWWMTLLYQLYYIAKRYRAGADFQRLV